MKHKVLKIILFQFQTIKDLQADQQYILAEDFQRILGVCQNFKNGLLKEQERIVEMKDEVLAAAGRVAHSVKISQTDHETIERLKNEIGLLVFNFFVFLLYF